MEYAYSILMGVFALALLLYAGLIPGAILVAVLVLIAGFGLAIWLGVKRMGDA